jgi:hypothetical protein
MEVASVCIVVFEDSPTDLTMTSACLADGQSTCSTSNNDIRHHLIVSTSTSATSPSIGRGTASSDFGTISTASPITVSTIYQSAINPYLTAISKESTNVVRIHFSN